MQVEKRDKDRPRRAELQFCERGQERDAQATMQSESVTRIGYGVPSYSSAGECGT
jgi:hypothetical protein